MFRRTTVIAGTFAIGCLAGLAQAQTESRPRTGGMAAAPRTPPPQQNGSKPRVAIIPPSPPAQAPSQTGFGQASNVVVVPRVLQFYYLPTVVLSDGRVLADFGTGRGYEQVLRKCPVITGTVPSNFSLAPCWAVDQYGRYSVLYQR